MKGVDPEAPSEDRLVAASGDDGAWVLIDPEGTSVEDTFVHLGYFDPVGHDLRSSGDIVSVRTGDDEFATYASVRCGAEGYTTPGCETDLLVRVDPQTGLVGDRDPSPLDEGFGLGDQLVPPLQVAGVELKGEEVRRRDPDVGARHRPQG